MSAEVALLAVAALLLFAGGKDPLASPVPCTNLPPGLANMRVGFDPSKISFLWNGEGQSAIVSVVDFTCDTDNPTFVYNNQDYQQPNEVKGIAVVNEQTEVILAVDAGDASAFQAGIDVTSSFSLASFIGDSTTFSASVGAIYGSEQGIVLQYSSAMLYRIALEWDSVSGIFFNSSASFRRYCDSVISSNPVFNESTCPIYEDVISSCGILFPAEALLGGSITIVAESNRALYAQYGAAAVEAQVGIVLSNLLYGSGSGVGAAGAAAGWWTSGATYATSCHGGGPCPSANDPTSYSKWFDGLLGEIVILNSTWAKVSALFSNPAGAVAYDEATLNHYARATLGQVLPAVIPLVNTTLWSIRLASPAETRPVDSACYESQYGPCCLNTMMPVATYNQRLATVASNIEAQKTELESIAQLVSSLSGPCVVDAGSVLSALARLNAVWNIITSPAVTDETAWFYHYGAHHECDDHSRYVDGSPFYSSYPGGFLTA